VCSSKGVTFQQSRLIAVEIRCISIHEVTAHSRTRKDLWTAFTCVKECDKGCARLDSDSADKDARPGRELVASVGMIIVFKSRGNRQSDDVIYQWFRCISYEENYAICSVPLLNIRHGKTRREILMSCHRNLS
jgi:hypothetical protein